MTVSAARHPMAWRGAFAALALLGAVAGWFHFSAARAPGVASPRAGELLAKLPLFFEPNLGQVQGDAGFLARGPGFQMRLGPREGVVMLEGKGGARVPVHMQFLGASAATLRGEEPAPGKSHYLKGSDPRGTRDVPHYAKVRYVGLYPGIDLAFYGNPQQLEYDFVVAPGADPGQIRLGFAGADALHLDGEGNLHLQLSGGDLVQRAPVAYQERDGERVAVRAGYVIAGGEVRLAVAEYDRGQPLVIDPILEYSSFLGGSGDDRGFAIAVDGNRNVYLTGYTASIDFPTTTGALDGNCNVTAGTCSYSTRDAFVAKISATGSLVYATYVGSDGDDEGRGIAVNSAGEAYVAGITWAQSTTNNFPMVNAFDASGALYDAFLFKLDGAGSTLLYSTYLGGNSYDEANAVVIDASGHAYVAGHSIPGGVSDPFPATSTFGNTTSCGSGAYVAKFDPAQAGSASLVYAARLCGSSFYNYAEGVAVDAAGNAYLTGHTNSPDFPTAGAYDASCGTDGTCNNASDAFVAKLNPQGTALMYSTFLGGSGDDNASFNEAIAVDAAGRAHVTGNTTSSDFPTTSGAYDTSHNGMEDIFVARLSADGAALEYATFLGGSARDVGTGIAVDGQGIVYLSGFTDSTWGSGLFPTLEPIQSSPASSNTEAIVAELNSDGSALLFSSFLGGSGNVAGGDKAFEIVLDDRRDAYVVGQTDSIDFPTQGPFQAAHGGGQFDTFVAKITHPVDLSVGLVDTPDPVAPGGLLTYTATVTNNTGSKDATNVMLTLNLPAGATLSGAATASQGSCSGTGPMTCSLGTLAGGGSATVTQAVTVASNASGAINADANVTLTEFDDNLANNSASSVATTSVATADNGAATGSGGGGGSLDWLALLGAGLLGLGRRGRRAV